MQTDNTASTSQPMPNLNTHLSFGNFDPSNMDMEEVVNTILLIDTSGSMSDHIDELNQQFAEIVKSMKDMSQSHKIFCSLGRFDSDIEVLTGFQQVHNVTVMPVQANGSRTRLYDACLEFIKNAVSQQQRALNAGILTKTVFGVITDGEDNASSVHSAPEIKNILNFINSDEATMNTFTSALVGIGERQTFEHAKDEMGIKNLFVFDANLSPKELRNQIKKDFFDGWFSASVSSASTVPGALVKF